MNEIQILSSQPWIWGWAGHCSAFFGRARPLPSCSHSRAFCSPVIFHRRRYGLACTALMAMAAAPPADFPDDLEHGYRSRTDGRVDTIGGGMEVADAGRSGFLGSRNAWFSIRLLGAFRFTRRLRATSYAAPAIWQQALDRIAAQMGGAQVRLRGSSMVNVPTVIGYLRPIILVPVAFLTGIPAEHVIALLAHEMAHIRRNDYIACILQSIADVVLFLTTRRSGGFPGKDSHRSRGCAAMTWRLPAGPTHSPTPRALAELESRRPVGLTTQLAANGGSLMDRIRRLIEPGYGRTLSAGDGERAGDAPAVHGGRRGGGGNTNANARVI